MERGNQLDQLMYILMYNLTIHTFESRKEKERRENRRSSQIGKTKRTNTISTKNLGKCKCMLVSERDTEDKWINKLLMSSNQYGDAPNQFYSLVSFGP